MPKRFTLLVLLTLISTASAQRPSGPIRYVDVTTASGISFHHHNGAFGKKYLPETMGSGVCVLDYDNDGWQDILFVNSSDWPGHGSTRSYPALYHNNGNGTFTDRTREAGLAVEMYGMGCAVGDYDNDGKDAIFSELITSTGQRRKISFARSTPRTNPIALLRYIRARARGSTIIEETARL